MALPLFVFLVCLLATAFANTEIVNIVAVEDTANLLPPSSWPVLSEETPELSFDVAPAAPYTSIIDVCESPVTPCPHETWAVLDLDSPSWREWSKFTLRISWPANHPAEFYIETFTPTELHSQRADLLAKPAVSRLFAPSGTRRQYARIRVIGEGVRVPSADPSVAHTVPFNVILEPLYYGILPASVAPVLFFLVPVVALALLVVAPRVHAYLASVAGEIHEEVDKKTM